MMLTIFNVCLDVSQTHHTLQDASHAYPINFLFLTAVNGVSFIPVSLMHNTLFHMSMDERIHI